MRFALRLLAALGPAMLAGSAVAEDPPAAAEPASYGGTPAEIAPYRDTGSYYWRFFTEPTPYRGPGRDKPSSLEGSTIKIGLIAPIENEHDSRIGTAMHQATLLAIEEANAQGGFRDSLPYELVLRNDSGLWGATSNTVIDLAYGEKVWGIIGSVDGANTHIALRVALKAEVPLVNTACTDPTLTETAIPWLVRCYPDDRQHGYRLAKLLFRQRELERVAIFRSNDKYGRMGVMEFRDAARRMGFPIPLEVRYRAGETDFSVQLERIRKLDPEAVVLWSNARDAARIVSEMRRLGMNQPVFGNDRLVSREFLEGASVDANGVVATCPMNPNGTGEEWLDFRDRYAKRFDETPDAFATFTYDGTRILLDAIERAGLNRALIRDELTSIRSYEGVSGPMQFDATHNNLGRLSLLEVQDGRFETLAD